MYDATYEQICDLQRELAAAGISQEECNLDNLAGCTYSELKSVVKAAIARKKKREAESK